MKNTTKIFTSSASNEWETPQDLFDRLNNKYKFTLDVASTDENAKCKKHFTINDNGLEKSWSGEIVFCNPPYGREIGKWVKKAYEESKNGTKIVMLIPARVDTKWFHEYLYNKEEENIKIEFIKGRLKFINKTLPNYREDGNFKASPAVFPSMLVYFNL